jgi:RNA polymerase sigma-70 factor, ECF subfamily
MQAAPNVARGARPLTRWSNPENRFGSSIVWMGDMIRAAEPIGSLAERESNIESTEARLHMAHLAALELDRAYRLAGLILGDAAEAEDAVGDALERAWGRALQLRDPAGFQAWFDRILVNVCRDRLRRRGRVRFLPLPDDAIDRRDPFRDILAQDEAFRAMADLSVDERTVLILHFWADLTLADVAARVGWPIGTVKSRLHRALERMRATAVRETRPEQEQ